MNCFSFRPCVRSIDGRSNASASASIPVCLSGKRLHGRRKVSNDRSNVSLDGSFDSCAEVEGAIFCSYLSDLA